MPKNAYRTVFFVLKAVKSPQRRGLCPRPPLDFGGWGLRPQTLCCYSRLLI